MFQHFKAGASSSSKSFLTVTWRPYTPVEICGKITRDGFARICWSCGKKRRLWKWSCVGTNLMYKVSSQTSRFGVQNPRNNDNTPTTSSHNKPLSMQVLFSPYYMLYVILYVPFFSNSTLSFKPSLHLLFRVTFFPSVVSVVVKQVIEMPKKDSTSSDKGASFGGRNLQWCTGKGQTWKPQCGCFFFGGEKVQIEVGGWMWRVWSSWCFIFFVYVFVGWGEGLKVLFHGFLSAICIYIYCIILTHI